MNSRQSGGGCATYNFICSPCLSGNIFLATSPALRFGSFLSLIPLRCRPACPGKARIAPWHDRPDVLQNHTGHRIEAVEVLLHLGTNDLMRAVQDDLTNDGQVDLMMTKDGTETEIGLGREIGIIGTEIERGTGIEVTRTSIQRGVETEIGIENGTHPRVQKMIAETNETIEMSEMVDEEEMDLTAEENGTDHLLHHRLEIVDPLLPLALDRSVPKRLLHVPWETIRNQKQPKSV